MTHLPHRAHARAGQTVLRHSFAFALLALALTPGLASAARNIAPTGTPYAWWNGLQATSDFQTETDSPRRDPAPDLVDGDDSDLRLGNPQSPVTGPTYQGAGIVWGNDRVVPKPPKQRVARVEFVNGSWESLGDGGFCADFQLQFSNAVRGGWYDSGWTASPQYSYDSAGVSGVTYVFEGPTVLAQAVRVVGRVRCSESSSYWANARELRVFDDSPEVTLWDTTAKPAVLDTPDDPTNLGTRFRSTVAGQVTGVRFYKSAANTGTHYASLWSGSGVLLAQTTFVNETASGWQQANFANPITITAETDYVVSYSAPVAHYSTTDQYFVDELRPSHGLLYAPKDGDGGGNALYGYGTAPLLPTASYRAENYWVDVVFVPTAN